MDSPFPDSPVFWSLSHFLLVYGSIVIGLFSLGGFLAAFIIFKAAKRKRALKLIDLLSYAITIVGFTTVFGPLLTFTNEISTIKARAQTFSTLANQLAPDYVPLANLCYGSSEPQDCRLIDYLEREVTSDTVIEGKELHEYSGSRDGMSEEFIAKVGRLNSAIKTLNTSLEQINRSETEERPLYQFATLLLALALGGILSFAFGLGIVRRTHEFFAEKN
jgi:hypothetical protein